MSEQYKQEGWSKKKYTPVPYEPHLDRLQLGPLQDDSEQYRNMTLAERMGQASMQAAAYTSLPSPPPQTDDDRYLLALQIASEDLYQTVDDLASKALAAQRISDGERARAGNPRIQSSFPAIRRAELLDLIVILKAVAERLERMKEDEEREI